MDISTPFKWRHFQAEIILLCIRWYLRYRQFETGGVHRSTVRSGHLSVVKERRSSVLEVLLRVFATQPADGQYGPEPEP